MQEEVWVEIEGYPNYAVSNFGRVLNVKRDYILTARPNTDGSLRVSLSNHGQVKDFYIHHLVAEAFTVAYKPGQQVIHLNGNKSDNVPGNLRIKRRPQRVHEDNEPIEYDATTDDRYWGKRVQVIETGEVFRTVRDCARYIEGDYASIYSCLRGERNTHKGFTFEYYDR